MLVDEYEFWDDVSVRSAEIRDVLDDFSQSTIELMKKALVEDMDKILKINVKGQEKSGMSSVGMNMAHHFEVIDEAKVLFKRDKITLTFEVESNLEDTKKTMELSKAVSDYIRGFQGAKLLNVGVRYEWNEEQEVKQSEEFLKANPDYGKKNGKSEKSGKNTARYQEKSESSPEKVSETELLMRKMKNGKQKNHTA